MAYLLSASWAKENKNKMENRGIVNSHLYHIKFGCLVDGRENILNCFEWSAVILNCLEWSAIQLGLPIQLGFWK